MHDDESIATFFCRVDEIVNSIKNLGEEIKYVSVVENILRSVNLKFDSKVSAIKERQDLKSFTVDQLHGILTTFEMRMWSFKHNSSNLQSYYKRKGKGRIKLSIRRRRNKLLKEIPSRYWKIQR